MRNVLWAATGIACALLIVVLVGHPSTHLGEQCTAAGGHLVRAQHGYLCIREDAIVKLPR